VTGASQKFGQGSVLTAAGEFQIHDGPWELEEDAARLSRKAGITFGPWNGAEL
jgi:hypothetical protein